MDFTKAEADPDIAVGEVASALTGLGRLAFDESIYTDSMHGREIVVIGDDGTSYTDGIFYVRRLLYQMKVVYPAVNNDPAGSSGISIFLTQFHFTNPSDRQASRFRDPRHGIFYGRMRRRKQGSGCGQSGFRRRSNVAGGHGLCGRRRLAGVQLSRRRLCGPISEPPKVEVRNYKTRKFPKVSSRNGSIPSIPAVSSTQYMSRISPHRAEKDRTIDEAAKNLIGLGRVTHDVSGRIDWNYGREIRVEDNNGTSYTDAIFFIDNQLYQIKVIYRR